MACSGEVQIDLESRADAERAAKNPGIRTEQKVHVETRGVICNRATGMARTDQRVTFVFPNGTGEAVGVEYHSEEGTVRLLRNVQFFLKPTMNDIARKQSTRADSNE